MNNWTDELSTNWHTSAGASKPVQLATPVAYHVDADTDALPNGMNGVVTGYSFNCVSMK